MQQERLRLTHAPDLVQTRRGQQHLLIGDPEVTLSTRPTASSAPPRRACWRKVNSRCSIVVGQLGGRAVAA